MQSPYCRFANCIQQGRNGRKLVRMSSDVKVKFNAALDCHQKGRIDKAEMLYKKIIDAHPNHYESIHLLGVINFERKNYERCVQLISRALKLAPNFVAAHCNLARCYEEMKLFKKAVEHYETAIKIMPNDAEAHFGLGNSYAGLGRHEDAVASHSKAISLKPNYADAYCNRGLALKELERYSEALENLEKAIALKPNNPVAFRCQGNVLKSMDQVEEATLSYEKAVTLKPDFAEVYSDMGEIFSTLRLKDKAVECYESAVKFKPDLKYIKGTLLYAKMQICDWEKFAEQVKSIDEGLRNDLSVCQPLESMAILNQHALLLKCAKEYVSPKQHETDAQFFSPPLLKKPKLSIGYYSADFRNHPVAFLTAELFELHDRDRFQINAFSIGPKSDDDMRKRLLSSFDHFFDVRLKSSAEIVALSREQGIDIAIDLTGYTGHCRPAIFVERAAPVQVNYLGFPGTLAGGGHDYIFADNVVIPSEDAPYFTEKIVCLPDSYLPSDRSRAISDRPFLREELDLPTRGFVFCCFNASYKITPAIFDLWMNILRAVDGSVLWLRKHNDSVEGNLRREATNRGIDPDRLIFAGTLSMEEHLARHRCADLFLDTLPYGAHTTASDALWAGLPVLTLKGDTFPGRVGASLLKAIDLPDLIATSPAEYQAIAIMLGNNPEKIKDVKARLKNNRLEKPLFNSKLFARNMEKAFEAVYARMIAGLPPENIQI